MRLQRFGSEDFGLGLYIRLDRSITGYRAVGILFGHRYFELQWGFWPEVRKRLDGG